jgi:hypothetical protein
VHEVGPHVADQRCDASSTRHSAAGAGEGEDLCTRIPDLVLESLAFEKHRVVEPHPEIPRVGCERGQGALGTTAAEAVDDVEDLEPLRRGGHRSRML